MEGQQPNLLITDDDRDFRETLAELLDRRGFRTILAEDGEQAVSIVQGAHIHLLMVDMHMPRLNGLDTLATLRGLSLSVPCILMSAKLDDSIVNRARELEASSILAKPFSMKTITQTVCNILHACYGWKF